MTGVRILTLVTLVAIAGSCANEKPLSGGAKDETPPTLVSSNPEHETINFEGEEIELVFDESVKVDQLSTQLIVTPRLEETPSFTIKRETVTFTLEEPLADSTTYVFNFREAIKDITEDNPARNLVLSISTGSFIDSMYVTGTVRNPYENKPVEAVVGAYPLSDTVDLFTGQPYYFTQSSASGDFSIKNMRAGKYRLYAWIDENGNLKADSRNEAYAFLLDTLNLNGDSIPPIDLRVQALDTQPFQINGARPNGRYYEINFNKPVVSYSLALMDSTQENRFGYTLSNKNKLLRFFNQSVEDSTAIILHAEDTLQQSIDDTLYILFEPSLRQPVDFTITPQLDQAITAKRIATVNFSFTKPVTVFTQDSLQWVYDSLNIFDAPLAPGLKWNDNRTQLTVRLTVPDSVVTMRVTPIDSLTSDTTFARTALTKPIQLTLNEGTFISIERDTSETKAVPYSPLDPTKLAILKGKITSDHSFHIVHLLKEGKIVKETTGTDSYAFLNIPPGEYQLRVLADRDGDGVWRPGNILLGTPPEPVRFYNGVITLRANWERTDVDVDMNAEASAPIPTSSTPENEDEG